MIVVNTSNEISADISARFRLANGLLRQHIATRVSINKLTLTYVSRLIVSQLSIAFRIAGSLKQAAYKVKIKYHVSVCTRWLRNAILHASGYRHLGDNYARYRNLANIRKDYSKEPAVLCSF